MFTKLTTNSFLKKITEINSWRYGKYLFQGGSEAACCLLWPWAKENLVAFFQPPTIATRGRASQRMIWASHRLPLRKETTLEEEDIGEQRSLLANSLLGPLPPWQWLRLIAPGWFRTVWVPTQKVSPSSRHFPSTVAWGTGYCCYTPGVGWGEKDWINKWNPLIK